MANPNPTCTVNGSATPVDVSASTSTTIALASTAGAVFWSLSCTSTDETSSAATVNAGLVINQGNKTATFTSNAVGSCTIWTSTVGVLGPGLDANGVLQPSLKTTFKVNVKAANGNRVTAVGELGEQGPFGWIPSLNTAAKAVASAATPVFYASLATLVPSSGRAVQDTDGFSAVKDGGQGTWRWSAGDTTPADGGTIAGTTGSGRWFRVFDEHAGFDCRWFGVVIETSAPVVDNNATLTAFFSACAAARRRAYLPSGPVGGYIGHTAPILLRGDFSPGPSCAGLRIVGDSHGADSAGGVTPQLTLWANFPVVTATAATITAVATVFGAYQVTFGGLTAGGGGPLANVAVGDQVLVSGGINNTGAGTNNNLIYTVVTISVGAGTFTAFATQLNFQTWTPSYLGQNTYTPVSPDSGLTLQFRKPQMKVYARGVHIEGILFDGRNTVSTNVDVTTDVNNNPVMTNAQFTACGFQNAWFGATLANIGPNTTYPNNTDQHVFDKCYFLGHTEANVSIPNSGGQCKLNVFRKCSMFGGKYGLQMKSGSFYVDHCLFQAHKVSDFAVHTCTDPIRISNTQGEGSRRFWCSQGSSQGVPVTIDNCRWDANGGQIVAGTVAQTNGTFAIVGTGTTFTNFINGDSVYFGGVFRVVNIVTDDTHMTLYDASASTASGLALTYAQGGPENIGIVWGGSLGGLVVIGMNCGQGSTDCSNQAIVGLTNRGNCVQATLIGCTYKGTGSAPVVMHGFAGAAGALYRSIGNVAFDGVTTVRIPEGIGITGTSGYFATGAQPAATVAATPYAIPNLALTTNTLAAGSGIANGVNLAIPYQGCTSLEVSGLTGAYSLSGLLGGVDGMLIELILTDAFAPTINHLDTNAAAGTRFQMPTGGARSAGGIGTALAAPTAGGYRVVRAKYSKLADAGVGAWRVLGTA